MNLKFSQGLSLENDLESILLLKDLRNKVKKKLTIFFLFCLLFLIANNNK